MSAPILVDGPALVQALRVEVATWQARSLGQRALVDAANAKQMGLIAADATKLQNVYDDVIARLYAVLDRVDASRPAATATAQQANTVPSTAVMVARLPPKLQGVYAQATNTAMSWPVRYVAVCELILAMTKEDPKYLVEQAETVYDEARRNLGGLVQVITTLRSLQLDGLTEVIKGIEATEARRQGFGDVAAYEEEIDCAGTALRIVSQSLTGGTLSKVADAATHLRRLRQDLAVGLQLRHLKR